MARTKKGSDLIGQTVMLTDSIMAFGGRCYPAGSRWIVSGVCRGKFHLDIATRAGSSDDPDDHNRCYLRHVPRGAFEVESEAREVDDGQRSDELSRLCNEWHARQSGLMHPNSILSDEFTKMHYDELVRIVGETLGWWERG